MPKLPIFVIRSSTSGFCPNPNTVRLCPPLVITKEQVGAAFSVLEDVQPKILLYLLLFPYLFCDHSGQFQKLFCTYKDFVE